MDDGADQRLMTRLAAGDETALVALHERHAVVLHRLGLRLLDDHGAAEELVQETFLRLWRNVARFDPERGSARTFVFAIARQVACDSRRRRASRPLRLLRRTEEAPDLRDDESWERLVLSLSIRSAMDELPDHHRTVLELRYREDLSHQQIARRLGIPLGTVRSRAFHGLRTLRVLLADSASSPRAMAFAVFALDF